LQCVAVCCSVLQCVAVCCSVLQCVAMCCSVLQCVAVCCSVYLDVCRDKTRRRDNSKAYIHICVYLDMYLCIYLYICVLSLIYIYVHLDVSSVMHECIHTLLLSLFSIRMCGRFLFSPPFSPQSTSGREGEGAARLEIKLALNIYTYIYIACLNTYTHIYTLACSLLVSLSYIRVCNFFLFPFFPKVREEGARLEIKGCPEYI